MLTKDEIKTERMSPPIACDKIKTERLSPPIGCCEIKTERLSSSSNPGQNKKINNVSFPEVG